jgi:D-alanyl-D-alanine dipeptidase
MKTLLLVIICLTVFSPVNAQQYRYIDSNKVMRLSDYQKKIADSPDYQLVEIKKLVPNIVLDIRYATRNNFMHKTMYKLAKAYARLPVAKALKEVQDELNKQGLGLKIFDAYRPYAVTVAFYELVKDTVFVASPRRGSRHNRGCAIDLTIINLKTGQDLDMPTPFDSFSIKAADNYPNLTKAKIANREMLKAVMEAHGFKINKSEWWHYDYNGYSNFPVMDIAFEELN